MKAIKYILFLLLIAIIGTAIYIAVQPNSFEVSRTRTIKAPSAVIYDNVIDFKNWEAWSSWVEADPDMLITIPEQTKGVGGSYSWQDKHGIGTMKTLKVAPNASIEQIMQFENFPSSDVNWKFTPNDDGSTDVTWTISGKDLPFDFKAFATFTGGMEKQIGPHYERSLEKLDSIVSASMKVYSIKIDDSIADHSGGYYLYNTASCKITELKAKMTEMLPKVGNYAMANNITMAGAPFTYYHKWDEKNNAVMFSSCVPTTTKVISTDSEILTGQIKPFKAVKTTLNGNYDNLKEAWESAMKYIPENGFEFTADGPMLETYLTDPMSTPNPADWVTEIYIAVK
ncbi:SRPBCC family protein [Flavivirga eckloniae]|uniref:Transcription activator effector-binding protein n=1 Tax=Flavivirga eckloniae TaxID=1803846 RepID=A0A2K9PVC8_9FLAO|nr:GyrI-like domain-containing protein [Flavivirga eckloniae]AUP81011.1 transcription activator effector-binding protein [Flavivirga eckloniae]